MSADTRPGLNGKRPAAVGYAPVSLYTQAQVDALQGANRLDQIRAARVQRGLERAKLRAEQQAKAAKAKIKARIKAAFESEQRERIASREKEAAEKAAAESGHRPVRMREYINTNPEQTEPLLFQPVRGVRGTARRFPWRKAA